MGKVKTFILGKLTRSILNDPVYKDYYVFEVTYPDGEKKLSPVLDHADYMLYEKGCRSSIMTKEITYYRVLGRGSEDEMSDLKYSEEEYLNSLNK